MKRIFLLTSLLLVIVIYSQKNTEIVQINTGIFLRDGEGAYLGVDYGVYPNVTAGVQVDSSFGSNIQEFPDYQIATTITEKSYSTTIGISVNGNYHFNTILNIPNTWDVYAGLSLAYEMGSSKIYYQNVPDDFRTKYKNKTNQYKYKPFPVFQIGGRYLFSNNLAINLEIGFRNMGFAKKIGVTYKF